MITNLRLILIGFSLLALAAPCYSEGGFVGGAELLQIAEKGRTATRPTLALKGRVTGSFDGGSGPIALLLDESNRGNTIFVGKLMMPSIGTDVYMVVAPAAGRSKASYDLVAWAYSSDVERARLKPTAQPRKQGPTVSRGSAEQRNGVDHTPYFDAYKSAISKLNPGLSDKRLSDITKVLLETSKQRDVDPRLIMAVVLAESGFNPQATSPKGAMGLGQLMPGTAKGMGLSNPYEPTQNLDAAIKILRSGIDKYSGKADWKNVKQEHIDLALAAYNAGSGAVRKYGGVPPYRETQNYIQKVTSYYRQLCGVK